MKQKFVFTLVKEATHVGLLPIIAKAGFTLAEVLITLGIIGVVAAMTIPNLIANTRSHQYRSTLKKSVSTLSQAARMAQAQYGYDYAGINTICINPGSDHPEEVMSICGILNGTLTGHTYLGKPSNLKLKKGNVEQSYSIKYTSPLLVTNGSEIDNGHAYALADGTLFIFPAELGNTPCTLGIGDVLTDTYSTGVATSLADCFGVIDVNGVNLPNKEVTCSLGSNSLTSNTCIVKNNAQDMTDIFAVRIHDGIVEPASAATRYVLKTSK